MPTYVNNDGLEVRFGASQGARGGKAGITTGSGKLRELVLFVDLPSLGANGTGFTADLNNDGINEAFNNTNTPIPANVLIVSQKVVQLVAPAGGTSYSIGTFLKDGTGGTVAGIRTTAGADGTQIGTMSGAAALYIAPVATGTYTAGKLKVVVSYVSQ